MTKNMTKGSPMKIILGFSIPLLFGFLFQQFYSPVDTLIVGRFLGKENLAAVGATSSINFLIYVSVLSWADAWQRCFWMHQKQPLLKMCECS